MTQGRVLLWRLGGVAFVLGSLAFVVSRLVADADAVAQAADQVRPQMVALSLVAAIAGLGLTALAWRTLLAGTGFALPVVTAGQVFFVSQIGKYLPGSVWPYLAQVRLGRDLGVPVSASAQTGVTFVLLHLLTGLVLGVPRVVLGDSLDRRFSLAIVVVPLLLVLVHPRAVQGLTELAARVLRVSVTPARMPWQHLAGAVGWLLGAWVLYGVSLAAVVAPFEPVSAVGFGLLLSSYALAWSVGFIGAALVVVAAPAGLGFREVALYATLAGVVSPGAAAVVVLASRVVMTVGDAVWALLAAASSRVQRTFT